MFRGAANCILYLWIMDRKLKTISKMYVCRMTDWFLTKALEIFLALYKSVSVQKSYISHTSTSIKKWTEIIETFMEKQRSFFRIAREKPDVISTCCNCGTEVYSPDVYSSFLTRSRETVAYFFPYCRYNSLIFRQNFFQTEFI